MIIPITKKISMVDAPNRAKYPYCNCLYINDTRRALIDNSCGQENLDYLLGQNIDIVINSHFHEDHILNNPHFQQAEIWAHRLDAPAISSMEVFQEFYGFGDFEQQMDTFQEYYGLEDLDAKQMLDDFIESLKLQDCKVHRELEDGDLLDFGTVCLRVIFAPGHTPGHCCFWEEKEQLLFSSDIDLSSFGPWYGHKCSDLDDYIASIQKCMELKPNIVVSSHNKIIKDNIPGFFQRYLDVIFRKEELVRTSLRKPSTLDELVEKQLFYGKGITLDHPFLKLAERMAIEKHLLRLLKMNEIEQSGDVYYLR